MSDFRERQQLGSLSMRKVSFYMEFIAKADSSNRASATRRTSRRTDRADSTRSVRDVSGTGVPDPWDIAEPPRRTERARQSRPATGYQLGSFYDDQPAIPVAEEAQAEQQYFPETATDAPRTRGEAAHLSAPADFDAPIDLDAPIDWGATYESAPADIPAYVDNASTATSGEAAAPVWDYGTGRWRDFLAGDADSGKPMEEPEGMRLNSLGSEDNILTEDELRRAMAFLNDDAFLVTGMGVSESARRSIEATSKIKPLTPDMLAFDIPKRKQETEPQAAASKAALAEPVQPQALEPAPADDEVIFTRGRVIPAGADSDFDPEAYERPVRARSGLRALIWVLLTLFVLSLGATAYLWFFTDLISFGNPIIDAYEVSLGTESMGCVVDGQAVVDAIEEDRLRAEEESGLPAEHSQPVMIQPIRVEKRFVATEDEMIEYIRQRSAIMVEAAGIYLDGRLIGAVGDEQVLEMIREEALAPFLSLEESRDLLNLGFVENLEARKLLIQPDALQKQEEIYAKLMGYAPFGQATVYEVEQGDSLSAIARRNDIPLAQLRYANPNLIGRDLITPGMQLRVEPAGGLLTVEFTERVRTEVSIPFETVTKTSSRMYTTQKETEQQGKSGVREILADRRYVAGVLVEETILEEKIITEPVSEIIVKGTKKASGSSSGSSRYIVPVSGKISSRFGSRWGSTHYGLDFSASTGTPIYAARDGTVTFSGTNSSYGKLVKIDHGGGVETRYAHCSSLKVSKGDKVKQGDLIALVGSTGRSTGPHLHFEVRVNGSAKDPERYLP